jgi:Fe-Mn family superoxide dismutase
MAGATAGIAVMPGESSSANADASLQGATSTTDTLTARAFRGQHQPLPLRFDPAKLKGLSEKLIRSHWENNYGGAAAANTWMRFFRMLIGKR